MKFESHVRGQELVQYIENATEREQTLDLDWFRGWFLSMSPVVEQHHLDEMLANMRRALELTGTTRGVWPVVLLLASTR
jgi:hypothetical protein